MINSYYRSMEVFKKDSSQPVVIYNIDYITNLRIGSIPIEDIQCGLILLCLITILYEWNIKDREIIENL